MNIHNSDSILDRTGNFSIQFGYELEKINYDLSYTSKKIKICNTATAIDLLTGESYNIQNYIENDFHNIIFKVKDKYFATTKYYLEDITKNNDLILFRGKYVDDNRDNIVIDTSKIYFRIAYNNNNMVSAGVAENPFIIPIDHLSIDTVDNNNIPLVEGIDNDTIPLSTIDTFPIGVVDLQSINYIINARDGYQIFEINDSKQFCEILINLSNYTKLYNSTDANPAVYFDLVDSDGFDLKKNIYYKINPLSHKFTQNCIIGGYKKITLKQLRKKRTWKRTRRH